MHVGGHKVGCMAACTVFAKAPKLGLSPGGACGYAPYAAEFGPALKKQRGSKLTGGLNSVCRCSDQTINSKILHVAEASF